MMSFPTFSDQVLSNSQLNGYSGGECRDPVFTNMRQLPHAKALGNYASPKPTSCKCR